MFFSEFNNLILSTMEDIINKTNSLNNETVSHQVNQLDASGFFYTVFRWSENVTLTGIVYYQIWRWRSKLWRCAQINRFWLVYKITKYLTNIQNNYTRSNTVFHHHHHHHYHHHHYQYHHHHHHYHHHHHHHHFS